MTDEERKVPDLSGVLRPIWTGRETLGGTEPEWFTEQKARTDYSVGTIGIVVIALGFMFFAYKTIALFVGC